MENNYSLFTILTYIVIFGDAGYILWIIYNAIDEGFRAGYVEIVSLFGLVFLLILNIILNYKNRRCR